MRRPPKLVDRKAGTLSGIAALVCCVLVGPPAAAVAAPISADEYSVKAAFLYNLAKFVDWPPAKFEHEDSPMIFGVVGEKGLENIRATVENKSIGQHKVVVRAIESAEEARLCHILFVTRSQKAGSANLVYSAAASAVLIVGETDKFLDAGGMIRFYLEADNLRLEINAEAARKAGVVIQASALATLINKGIAKLKKV
jgi:hypothetical protein